MGAERTSLTGSVTECRAAKTACASFSQGIDPSFREATHHILVAERNLKLYRKHLIGTYKVVNKHYHCDS